MFNGNISEERRADSLLYELDETEDEINRVTKLLEKFQAFKQDPSLSEVEKVIDSYERLKNNRSEPVPADEMF